MNLYSVRIYDRALAENEVKQNASGIKGKQEWSKQHTVNITLEDIGEAGIVQPFKYLWAQGTVETDNGYKTETEFNTAHNAATGDYKGTFNNGGSITTPEGVSGDDWYLWILAKDNLGNTRIIPSGAFWLDNTNPTLEATPETSTVVKNTDVTLTLTDAHSRLNDVTNSYQYYLSTSDSELTSEAEGSIYGVPQSLTTFTLAEANDTDVRTATINIGSTETGTRYLFVKAVKDNMGNESIQGGTIVEIDGINYHRFGPYEFDNLSPVVTFEPEENTTYEQSQSSKVTLTERGTADFNTSTFKYLWTTDDTTPTAESFDTALTTATYKGTFTNGGTVSIDTETGNNWNLWISAEDNLGNRLVEATGTFYLDNTKPTVDVTNIDAESATENGVWQNADITITVTEEHAKLSSDSLYYFLSTSEDALTSEEEGSPYGEPQVLNEITLGTENSSFERTATISKLGWNSLDDSKTNETGLRYLFIKAEEDNAGNISSEYGTLVTIADGEYAGTYHRFGAYVFDNAPPQVEFDPDGGDWKQSYNVEVKITEVGEAGIDTSSLKYLWIENSQTLPSLSEFTNSFTAEETVESNGTVTQTISHIATPVAETGDNWTLWILVKDNLGEANVVSSKIFQLDNATPVMQITTGDSPSIEEVCKSTDVTISFNETHSGLAEGTDLGYASEANSYQYYLSTSSTGLIGGKWFDYTKGTTFTIGQDDGNGNPITGRRYLFVKTVKDKANNESSLSVSANSDNTDSTTSQTISETTDTLEVNSVNGTTVTIDGTEYHRFGNVTTIDGTNYHMFGEFVFDNTEPEITIEYNDGEHNVYQKSQKTTVTIRDNTDDPTRGEAGVDTTTLKYQWNQSSEVPTEGSFDTAEHRGTFTTLETDITSPEGVTGNNWYLWILAKDNLENTAIVTTNPFCLDNTNPTVTATNNYPENQNVDVSGQIVTRYADVTLVLADQNAGLPQETDPATLYQYYLSTSNTELEGSEWVAYQSGTAFRIGEGITDTRYLFVKQISDNAGNLSEQNGTLTTIGDTKYHLMGTYVFDNTVPDVTIAYDASVHQIYEQSQSVTVTVEDNDDETPNAGIDFANSLVKYEWTNDSTPLTQKDQFTNTMTESTQSLVVAGYTGYKYLWIYAEDNIGNSTIVSKGPFYLDNTKPVMNQVVTPTTSVGDNVWKSANVTITFTEEHAGLVTEADNYQYYLSTSATALDGGTLTNYTAGIEFTIGEGQTGTRYLLVKAVKDEAGNESDTNTDLSIVEIDGQNYHVFGPYKFDNSPVTQYVTDGLIRYYDAIINTENAHSNSTTVWKDLSGHYDGTINGATVNNNYISFDGTNDWVNAGELPTGLTQVTFEATVMINSLPSSKSEHYEIISNTNTGGIGLYVDGEYYLDKIVFNLRTTEQGFIVVSSKTLEVGKVYNISATYDGESIKLYVDGKLEAETEAYGVIKAPTYNTVLGIGVNTNGSAPEYGYADMNLYSTRIYDRALTAAEVLQNATGLGGNATYAQEHTVQVNLDDIGEAGEAEPFKYLWVQGSSTFFANESEFNTKYDSLEADYKGEFNNGATITTPAGESGNDWILWVLAKDNLGNTIITHSNEFWLDNTNSELHVTVTSNSTTDENIWKSAEVTLTATDDQAGIDTSKTYKYYLSTSSTVLENAVSGTFTLSGDGDTKTATFTPGAIGADLTDTRYLFIENIYDNAGNATAKEDAQITVNGVSTVTTAQTLDNQTVDGASYHVFGEYKFDNSAPAITITTTDPDASNPIWSSEHTAEVTIVDVGLAGLDTSTFKYVWVNEGNLTDEQKAVSEATFADRWNDAIAKESSDGVDDLYGSFTNANTSITTPTDNGTELISGSDWYLWILAKDKLGNTVVVKSTQVHLDNEIPKFELTPSSGGPAKVMQVLIKSVEEKSGLAEDNMRQYYLSTSSTALEGGEWKDYDSEVEETIGTGLTGTYYLYIKQLKDKAGNESNTIGDVVTRDGILCQMFGPYIFDNSNPTVEVNLETSTNTNASDGKAVSTQEVTITLKDVGDADLDDTNNNYEYFLSSSSEELLDGSWISYEELLSAKTTAATNNTAEDTRTATITIGTGITGTRYLFIRTISDNARTLDINLNATDTVGNVSTSEGTLKTIDGETYHMFGEYVFDNSGPSVTVTPETTTSDVSDDGKAVLSQDVTIILADIGTAGLATNDTQYYVSSSDERLVDGEWKDYTSGTAFTIGAGKTGEYYLYVKQVADKLGHLSITNGELTTIDDVVYHRFGPYVFDNSSPVAEYVTDGLIRYYDAYNNTGSGHSNSVTTWKDLSGNYDATINGATVNSNNVSFDGVDDYVNAGELPTGLTEITYEITVMANSLSSTTSYIMGNSQSGGVGLYLQEGEFGFYTKTNGAYNYLAYKDEKPEVGKVYNISATYDGTTMKLYIDGILKEQLSASGEIDAPTNNTVLAIGSNPYGDICNGEFSNINVYSARVYDRAITEAEIKQNNGELAGNITWKQEHTVTVALTDIGTAGVGDTFDYLWVQGETEIDEVAEFTAAYEAATGDYKGTCNYGDSFTTPAGVTGDDWKVLILAKDKLGNTGVVQSGDFWLDNTKPQAIVEPDSAEVCREIEVTVSAYDEHSGLKYATYEYYLSGSSEALVDCGWGGWTEYVSTESFTIGRDEANNKYVTGEAWLFLKVLNDYAGNDSDLDIGNVKEIDGVEYHVFGPYIFDNSGPKVTVVPETTTNATATDGKAVQSQNVSITVEDIGQAGLVEETDPATIYQYYLSSSSGALADGEWTTYTLTKDTTSTTDKRTGIITIGENLTGTYYLFIRTINDTLGNVSESEGLTTISGTNYHMFGEYVFDNTAPAVTFNPEGGDEWAKSHSVVVTVRDDSSKEPNTGTAGVNGETLKYQWIKGDETPTEESFTKSFTNSQTLSIASGTGNDWYLWVLAEDNVGNTTMVKSEAFWLDNSAPVVRSMIAIPESETTYTIIASGIKDNRGDIEPQSGVKGYLITTDDNRPAEDSDWIPITSDTVTYDETTESYIVRYSGAEQRTTYYIWTIDNVGNISGLVKGEGSEGDGEGGFGDGENTTVTTRIIIYSINNTSWYETFEEAVDAASTSSVDTIYLLKDYTDTSDGTVDKNVKFSPNGYTLTRGDDTLSNDYENAIIVSEGASLEILGTGTIQSTSTSYPTLISQGNLKVTSGNVTNTQYAVISARENGNVEIAGGTITSETTGNSIISNIGNGNVTVSGGTVEGNTAHTVIANGSTGTILVTGGNIRNEQNTKGAIVNLSTGNIRITEGNVEARINSGSGTVELTGGTITGDIIGGIGSKDSTTSNIILNGATVTGNIYGGNDMTNVTESNITLLSGTLDGTVYGGGNGQTTVGTVNITLNGATITSQTIYGGANVLGTVENANVDIKSGTLVNVYGGGTQGGTTLNTTVTIEAGATITGNVYGGAHKATIGNEEDNSGSTTVNIVGGTINGNVYGGSDTNTVYGATTINIGKDAVGDSTLTSGEITIVGDIFGGGHKDQTVVEDDTETEDEEVKDFTEVSVTNGTHINIDGNETTINLEGGDIFGSGERTTYEGTASITIKNLGATGNPYLLDSIQRTGTLTIDNSDIEIIGVSDSSNANVDASYTLNRIDTLNIQNGTYLYLRRGFNVVGGLNSLAADGSKATVTIENNAVTSKNVDNRIYVYEGVNLFIAKEEYSKTTPISEYGKVTGMTFFGMYSRERSGDYSLEYDVYDPTNPTSNDIFIMDSYVEGLYDESQAITVDGFYTNAVEDSSIINKYVTVITAEPTYQDWMLGDEKVYTQEVTLVAQRNKQRVYQSIPLDYLTQQGAEYEVKLFSANSLEPDIKLVSKTSISRVASSEEVANTTFALSMKNGSGWQNSGETYFYTSDNPIQGTTVYLSDYSGEAPYLDLYLHNSINITETKDCGYANIVLEVTKTTNGDASEGEKFKIAISVNIQTIGEAIEGEFKTDASITDGVNFDLITENEIFITDRSSMTTYFDMYPLGTIEDDDYRVLSSTCELPAGTQLTMVDYGEDEAHPKVYYYEVKEGDGIYEEETERYIYDFTNFILMSSVIEGENVTEEEAEAAYYSNNNEAYQNSGFEEYKILIDFKNATIENDLLEQNIRFELRESDGYMKNYEILPTQFNIYADKRSELTLDVTKDSSNVYDIIDNGELGFTIKSIMTTQSVEITSTYIDEEGNEVEETITYPINDTYYDEKKLGMAISLYDSEGNKVPYEKVKGIYYVVDGQEYYPDLTGTARWYLSDNIVTVEKAVKMYIEGGLLDSGTYQVRIENFASDNGTYFGTEGDNQNNTTITMIDLSHGLEVSISDGDRVIDSETGKTHHGTNAMNIKVKASDVVSNTNIRVSLYKRDITYNADADNNLSYADVTYTLVNLANYVSNTLTKPSEVSLTASNSFEYMVTNSVTEQTTLNFILNLKEGLATGGYKLQFSLYSGDNCIGTVERHFVVTNLVDFRETLSADDITAEHYGGVVTNYSPDNGISDDPDANTYVGWKIFHSDGENIYLIADDYVDLQYVPAGKGGTTVTADTGSYARGFSLAPYVNYAGASDISTSIANKWLSKSIGTTTSTNLNMKATAYLLDTTQWSGFADSSYAEYAVGGPTLELFTASYNATHPTKTIESQANETGYQVKWSTSEDYVNNIGGLSTLESLYVINSTTNAFGMWVASPYAGGTNKNDMMRVDAHGYVNGEYCGSSALGTRPIVCLKSTTGIELQADGTYLIVE